MPSPAHSWPFLANSRDHLATLSGPRLALLPSKSSDRGQRHARAALSFARKGAHSSAMSNKEDVRDDDRDPLDPSPQVPSEIPAGLDRRKFIMRSAVISAAAVMNGCTRSETERSRSAASSRSGAAGAGWRPPVPLSADLNVVKKEKGPVMTTVDEFYKVGPGPSSSHTIGPMRITYDFYQRCHQAAGRPTRQGDGAPGQPVRQPQRDRQGTRHGTRRARGAGREGTGDRRSRCFSTACATSLTSRSR